MTITPTVTIDASGLNMALSKAGQFTRRAPAQAANTAALEVAYGAQKGLPAVTVDKMDTELAVETTIIRDKTGRVRKKKFVGKAGTSRNFPSLPLAVLIIQARANPQSNYNNLTNLRYAGPSPFKGKSRAAGAAAMRKAVHDMIARRHKSGSFLRAGWGPAIKQLKPFARATYMINTPRPVMPNFDTRDLGFAEPALPGKLVAQCTIENSIGYEGKNQRSFDEALQKYGAPALQNALDNEGRAQMDYYLSKAGKDLAAEWRKYAGTP